MPKASIIIATHNRPHLLPRAVNSARASGTDVEIVVVDDASSDGTAEICKALSNINYARIERNQGVAGARNIGLVASSGEYISFLDDDDVRLADSLDEQIAILEKEPLAGLIYGQAIPEDHAGKQHNPYPFDCPQGDIFWELLSHYFIPCCSAVFLRSSLSRVGMLDDSMAGVDDWDLWVRIAEIYPVIAVEKPSLIWRRSTPASKQGTSQAAQLVSRGVRQFRQCWMKLPRATAAATKTRREAWRSFSENMAEHLIWESGRALRFREIRQACKNLSLLPRLHPLTITRIVKNRLSSLPWATSRKSWRGAISNPDQASGKL